jgi:hypothetical protein
MIRILLRSNGVTRLCTVSRNTRPGLRMSIHFIRIRIQHLRLNIDPDPEPFRIQGFYDKKKWEKKVKLKKRFCGSKIYTLQRFIDFFQVVRSPHHYVFDIFDIYLIPLPGNHTDSGPGNVPYTGLQGS